LADWILSRSGRARRPLGFAAFAVVLFAWTAFGAVAAPSLVEHVRGYTLVADRLQSFGALVFDAGRVVAIGTPRESRRRYPDAVVIPGRGRILLPGLIDAHGHVLDLGLESTEIALGDTLSLREALARVAAYATANPREAWLLGSGWNQVKWHLGRFPRSDELDAVVAARPVVLSRVDGHALWLNTKALAAAGIVRDTPDPPGGRIERDADGSPSGVLVDKAMALVERVIPPPSEDRRREALRAALKSLNAFGLTSVGDAGVAPDTLTLYRDFADRGLLTVRIYAMIADQGDDFSALLAAGPMSGYAEDRLSVRAVKLFADGALGSRGAALLAPYADQPSQSGLLFMSDAQMRSKIQAAMAAGFQVNVHAIGDAANRQVLDAFAAAYAAVGGSTLRNRIEHAQVVALADIPRFKALDLVASMQPTHATSDMNMAEDRIGPERLAGAYAWRSFLAQGTRIAGGSDFPVESPNPFFGLHAAVTRTDHAGRPRGGWRPEQAMTRIEAFRAFTLDAAFAQHQERVIGSLEPGKWADFILVDRDPFTIPAADLWRIRVEQTWIAGARVF
jgi:predicted amidohydrolase YtcJ